MKKILLLFILFGFLEAVDPEALSEKIWKNESGKSFAKLVWWNQGEEFPSLGIGHFIWFPPDKELPYTETFPLLLEFLQQKGVGVPEQLLSAEGCPWRDRDEWLGLQNSCQMEELRAFLCKTRVEQAEFIADRFEQTREKILAAAPEGALEEMRRKLQRLEEDSAGMFALIDYSHFKGDGTNEKERYHGEGWGLLQALFEMDGGGDDPLDAFVNSAKMVLKRRVANAPAQRNEQRWLKGWVQRVEAYTHNE